MIDKRQIIKEHLKDCEFDQLHDGSYVTIKECVEMMKWLREEYSIYVMFDGRKVEVARLNHSNHFYKRYPFEKGSEIEARINDALCDGLKLIKA